MGYDLVFDARLTPSYPVPLFIGLVMLLAGAYLWSTRKSPQHTSGGCLISPTEKRTVFACSFFMFGLLATVAGSVGFYGQERAERALRNGNFKTVEGAVEYFRPMYGGKVAERFTVRGITFSYSHNIWNPGGFDTTANQGGPIQEGLLVRVGYIDRGVADYQIVRLEVRRDAASKGQP